MRDNPSIADQAVYTLGEIERIAVGLPHDDKMRHTLRKMKRAAEQAVLNGLGTAQDIVDSANMMISDMATPNA